MTSDLGKALVETEPSGQPIAADVRRALPTDADRLAFAEGLTSAWQRGGATECQRVFALAPEDFDLRVPAKAREDLRRCARQTLQGSRVADLQNLARYLRALPQPEPLDNLFLGTVAQRLGSREEACHSFVHAANAVAPELYFPALRQACAQSAEEIASLLGQKDLTVEWADYFTNAMLARPAWQRSFEKYYSATAPPPVAVSRILLDDRWSLSFREHLWKTAAEALRPDIVQAMFRTYFKVGRGAEFLAALQAREMQPQALTALLQTRASTLNADYVLQVADWNALTGPEQLDILRALFKKLPSVTVVHEGDALNEVVQKVARLKEHPELPLTFAPVNAALPLCLRLDLRRLDESTQMLASVKAKPITEASVEGLLRKLSGRLRVRTAWNLPELGQLDRAILKVTLETVSIQLRQNGGELASVAALVDGWKVKL